MLTLRKFLSVVLALTILVMPAIAEDRSILLVTARGVWQSDVVNGVPGPFVMKPYDVVIQGIGLPVPPGDDPTTPDPPATDPQVVQIAAISKSTLKDAAEGTAVAAIISSLVKLVLTGSNFKEALLLAAPIADTSLKAEGRINKWVKDATAISSDPAKLKAGVVSAFGISAATLESIHAAAVAGPEAALTGEALDWGQIIAIIQMIIQLLKNLGIIPA